MSHQTRYKSALMNMSIAAKAMKRLGFELSSEKFITDTTTMTFTQKGSVPVHLIQKLSEPITVSTDLHVRSSEKVKRLLGTPENQYENLASVYNAIQLSEHFTAQGWEVTEQQIGGEIVLTVGMQEAW